MRWGLKSQRSFEGTLSALALPGSVVAWGGSVVRWQPLRAAHRRQMIVVVGRKAIDRHLFIAIHPTEARPPRLEGVTAKEVCA